MTVKRLEKLIAAREFEKIEEVLRKEECDLDSAVEFMHELDEREIDFPGATYDDEDGFRLECLRVAA